MLHEGSVGRTRARSAELALARQAGGVSDQTEIIVHPVSPKGGRKVTVHALGVDADLGRAHTPRDGPITWEGGGPEVWKRPDE